MCSETEMTTSLKSTDLYHLSGMMLLIILTASSDQGCDSNILYEPYINRSSTKAFNWSWIKYKILCIIISQCNCFFKLELGNTARSIYLAKSEYQFDVIFQK